jgi:hypothetical protein
MSTAIRIRTPQDEFVDAYDGFVLDKTDGLLAITREAKGAKWKITHMRTGAAFPFEFDKVSDAVDGARNVFREFPQRKLRTNRIEVVTNKMPRSKVETIIYGANQ